MQLQHQQNSSKKWEVTPKPWLSETINGSAWLLQLASLPSVSPKALLGVVKFFLKGLTCFKQSFFFWLDKLLRKQRWLFQPTRLPGCCWGCLPWCWKYTQRYSPAPGGCIQCLSTDLFVLERRCILRIRGSKLGDAWRIWDRRPVFGLLPCREQSTRLLERWTALAFQVFPGCQRQHLCPSETSCDWRNLSSKRQTQEGTAEEVNLTPFEGGKQRWASPPPAEHPLSPFCTDGAF